MDGTSRAFAAACWCIILYVRYECTVTYASPPLQAMLLSAALNCILLTVDWPALCSQVRSRRWRQCVESLVVAAAVLAMVSAGVR